MLSLVFACPQAIAILVWFLSEKNVVVWFPADQGIANRPTFSPVATCSTRSPVCNGDMWDVWCSFSQRLNAATKHLIHYLDAEPAVPPAVGTSYCRLSRLTRLIDENGYFDLLVSDNSVNVSAGKCLCYSF